jgi:hypothetical protein
MNRFSPLSGYLRYFSRICGNFWIFTILIGCTAPQIAPPRKRPPLNSQHIIKQIDSESRKTQDLSGFSKFRIQSQGKSISGTVAINLKKETFLRLELLNLFSQPIQYFLANQHRLISYHPGKKSAISGKPNARNVNRLIGIRMKVEELVSYLLGDFPDLALFQEKSISYEPGTDRYRLEVKKEDEIRRLWIDPDTFRPRHYRSTDKNGNPRLLVSWDDFSDIKDISFARKISIEFPREEASIQVRYTDFDLNTNTGSFFLEIPPETRIVLLEP